ncbi:O-antigen ligase family protein [Lentibacillus saliphilus]|uniref:O-antigen ligase family protein n=1 Tax=Lentibacillus saliphilus TaxID=2737028 RepID=UPI001C2FD383|nr:O-antigen ligase family protein [Lentibacillus saliphilus]
MNYPKSLYTLTIATIIILSICVFMPPSITVLVSSLSFAIIVWKKPKWIIPLLIMYFSVRPFLLEINDGLKLAGDAAIITLFIRVTWDAVKKKNFKQLYQLEWYEWAYILFCTVGAISALFTDVMLVAIIFQLRKFLIMYVLFYGVKRLEWQQQDFFAIMKLTVGVALVLIAHGFVEKLSQRQWLLPETWVDMFLSPANADRIYGLLGNPNSMAMYLFIAMVASLILLNITKQKIWYIPAILGFGTFLMTYSRGSMIAIFAVVAFYLLVTKSKQFLKQFIIIGILGYVCVFTPVEFIDNEIENIQGTVEQGDENSNQNSTIGDRFGSSFSEENISLSGNTGRLFFVKKGFEILSSHLVIGTGFGTFGDSAALVYSSPIYEEYGLKGIYSYIGRDFYSDNQYIQIIVQTGIVGTLLFALFMLNMLWHMWQTRKENVAFANILMSLWVFVAIVGIVYNVWENQMFTFCYFTLLAWMEIVRRGKLKGITRTDH